jgi:hypothetical protein
MGLNSPTLSGTQTGTQPPGTGRYGEGRRGRCALGNANEMGRFGTTCYRLICPKQHFKTGALNHSATLPNHC